mgnify:FL=1
MSITRMERGRPRPQPNFPMRSWASALLSRVRIAILLATAPIASAQIPPPTDAPKPRTPEESAAAFKLPAGFRMEVIASEPLLASMP